MKLVVYNHNKINNLNHSLISFITFFAIIFSLYKTYTVPLILRSHLYLCIICFFSFYLSIKNYISKSLHKFTNFNVEIGTLIKFSNSNILKNLLPSSSSTNFFSWINLVFNVYILRCIMYNVPSNILHPSEKVYAFYAF